MKNFNEEDVRKTYRFLAHKANSEIRLIDPRGEKPPISVFVDNEEDFVKKCRKFNGKYNIYVGINERHGKGKKSKDVAFVKTIVIDIDPIRPDKGQASTDDELECALSLAREIIEEEKLKASLNVSGNGAQIWIAIPEEKITDQNRPKIEEQIKEYHRRIKEKYETDKTEIDIIGDLARVIKVIGTLSIKGEPTEERPWRVSKNVCGNFARQEDEAVLAEIKSIKVEPAEYEIGEIRKDIVRLITSDKRMRKLWERGRDDGDRSKADFELCCFLLKKNIPEEVITDTIWHFEHGKARERDARYISGLIKNAKAAIREEEGKRIWPTCFAQTDDIIAELTYDQGREPEYLFAVYEKKTGRIEMKEQLELNGKICVPVRDDLTKSGSVLLPSEPRPYNSEAELVDKIKNFIHNYVDIGDDWELLSAYYVLFTWIYDDFGATPYLRAFGDPGTGKTRLIEVVGSICYKPSFAGGATTPSPIFRMLERYRGTLILDESDMKDSEMTSCITKILTMGHTPRFPVLRSEESRKGHEPKAFYVFGPKLIASRELFKDRAVETRCLRKITYMTQRKDIPVVIDYKRFNKEALELRNMLLMWRFENLGRHSVDPGTYDKEIEPRLNQILMPLKSIIRDKGVLKSINALGKRLQKEVVEERSLLTEAAIFGAILRAREAGIEPTLKRVAEFANEELEGERPLTPRRCGWFVRNRLRLPVERTRGGHVIVARKRDILRLSEIYGEGKLCAVEGRPSGCPSVEPAERMVEAYDQVARALMACEDHCGDDAHCPRHRLLVDVKRMFLDACSGPGNGEEGRNVHDVHAKTVPERGRCERYTGGLRAFEGGMLHIYNNYIIYKNKALPPRNNVHTSTTEPEKVVDVAHVGFSLSDRWGTHCLSTEVHGGFGHDN